jgi:hypothetical protein
MLDGSVGLWLASGYMLLYVLGCERDMGSWLFRLREEACGGAGNKACREKMRRDRLNDRLAIFLMLYTFWKMMGQ